MTATTVNGRTVIAVEKAETHLSKPGTPIYYRNIQRLLLDDESEVFGCVHCDFTSLSAQGCYFHVRKVHPRHALPAKVPATSGPDLNGVTIADLLTAGQQVEALSDALVRMTEDRNEWRARARAAEKWRANLQALMGSAK